MMKNSIKFLFWKYAPTFYFLFLVLFNASLPFSQIIQPALFLAPLFFWAVYSPTQLILSPIFIISIIHDGMHRQFLGVSGAEWFLLFYLFSSQKYFWPRMPFIGHWGIFGFFLCIDVLIYFSIHYENFSWEALSASLLGIALTFVLYPFLSHILFVIHRRQENILEN